MSTPCVSIKKTQQLVSTAFLLAILAYVVLPSVPQGESSTSTPALTPFPAFQSSNYDGVNLLFIIDQSGSMGGPPYGGPPDYAPAGNDPLGLRFAAPQYSLDWIRSVLEAFPPDDIPTVNIALLAFGTNPREILQWTTVYKGYSTTDWELLEDQIVEDMSNERFRNTGGDLTNLVFTDFFQAFQRAREMFQNTPTAPAGERYLSTIIMLTDGAPCRVAGEDGCTPNICHLNPQPGTSASVDHLLFLRDFLATSFPDYWVYVAGIDEQNEYWPCLSPYWQQIVCLTGVDCNPLALRQIKSPEEMTLHFNAVLGDLMSQIEPDFLERIEIQVPGTFDVPPYQQMFRLNVFKSSTDPLGSSIQIIPPTGSPPPITVTGIDTAIEVHQVNLPQPGSWTVDVADLALIERVNFAADIVRAAGRMDIEGVEATQANTVMVDQYDAVDFRLRIVDGDDTTLTLYPGDSYPLTVTADIYDAADLDSARRSLVATVPMVLDTVGAPGVNQYIVAWHPQQAGVFEVRVTATYVWNGQTEYLLNEESVYDGFHVQEVYFEKQVPASSQREDEPVMLNALVRQRTTGDQVVWATNNFVMQVSAISTIDGITLWSAVLPNASDMNGVISTQVTSLSPGQYQLKVRVGIVKEEGSFEPLDVFEDTYPLEIRPWHNLSLHVTVTPAGKAVDAYEFGLVDGFPFFWSNTPVLVQVALYDAYVGQPVSLQAITGIQGDTPNLLMRTGDDTEDLTMQLREGHPGIYTFILDDLGRGDYEFQAGVNISSSQLREDYRWQQSTHRTEQTRTLPMFFVWGGLGVIGTTLLLTMMGVMFYRYQRNIRMFPVVGSITVLYLSYDDPDYGDDLSNAVPINTLQFTSPRNRHVFRGKAANPFGKVVVAAPRDEKMSQQGVVEVESIIADGQELLARPLRVSRDGQSHRVWQSDDGEYIIIKDYEAYLSGYYDVADDMFGDDTFMAL